MSTQQEERIAKVRKIVDEHIACEGYGSMLYITHGGLGLGGTELGFDPVPDMYDVGSDMYIKNGYTHFDYVQDGGYFHISYQPKKMSFAELIAKQKFMEKTTKTKQYRVANVHELVGEIYESLIKQCSCTDRPFPCMVYVHEDRLGLLGRQLSFNPIPLVEDAIEQLKLEMAPGLDEIKITIEAHFKDTTRITFDYERRDTDDEVEFGLLTKLQIKS